MCTSVQPFNPNSHLMFYWFLSLFPFIEYGSAAGVGPVKKREHVAARQTEQVHGRLTLRDRPCTTTSSPSDIEREKEGKGDDDADRSSSTTRSNVIAAAHSLRGRCEEEDAEEHVDSSINTRSDCRRPRKPTSLLQKRFSSFYSLSLSYIHTHTHTLE